jgi:trehalose 6-phosphate synthase/phosphatase
VKPGDILWINDYHFLLLPGMLRRALAHKIGFFLHIPFPEPSIFDRLPFRDDLLEGILGADQIGVYTDKYKNRLLDCIGTNLTGRNTGHGLAGTKRRPVSVGVFPLGIDTSRIRALLANAEVRTLISALRARFAGKRIILSVDRLDYTKSIPQKLCAYEMLLEAYPKFREQVQLALIVAPSRMSIATYTQLNKEISSLVQGINTRYATSSWEPIHFVNRVVPYEEILAYCKVADMAVITPREDAMNFVAKEYMYVGGGPLVLSKNAGAAIELTGAFLVDPMNEEEIAKAMQESLLADKTEIVRRNAPMVSHLLIHTAIKGAKDFLRPLRAG